MAKSKLLDIDSEFDGLEDFFDENAIKQRTGIINWYQTAEAKEIVKTRNQKTSKSDDWKIKQKTGAANKYAEDSEYNVKRKQSLRVSKGRKIVTPFGEFDSGAEFNEQKIVKCKFLDCKKMMPHLYYYKDQGPGPVTYEEVLYSPYGIFPKGNQGNEKNSGGKDRALASAQKNKDPIAVKYKDKYAWWDSVSVLYPKKYFIKKEPRREWYKK